MACMHVIAKNMKFYRHIIYLFAVIYRWLCLWLPAGECELQLGCMTC